LKLESLQAQKRSASNLTADSKASSGTFLDWEFLSTLYVEELPFLFFIKEMKARMEETEKREK
jgi:hypothetical protein